MAQGDEVGRLSAPFATMLRRLATAREARERLVQDAVHGLRTPLASLPTKVSVLRRIDKLPAEARSRLIDDLRAETCELSHLVDQLTLVLDSDRDHDGVASGPPTVGDA